MGFFCLTMIFGAYYLTINTRLVCKCDQNKVCGGLDALQ